MTAQRVTGDAPEKSAIRGVLQQSRVVCAGTDHLLAEPGNTSVSPILVVIAIVEQWWLHILLPRYSHPPRAKVVILFPLFRTPLSQVRTSSESCPLCVVTAAFVACAGLLLRYRRYYVHLIYARISLHTRVYHSRLSVRCRTSSRYLPRPHIEPESISKLVSQRPVKSFERFTTIIFAPNGRILAGWWWFNAMTSHDTILAVELDFVIKCYRARSSIDYSNLQ